MDCLSVSLSVCMSVRCLSALRRVQGELCGGWIERHRLAAGQWELCESPYYSPTRSVTLVDFDEHRLVGPRCHPTCQ